MTRCGPVGLMISVAAATSFIALPARANDPATATMLFNEARRLMAAHKYPEACPKFEESQRLDPGLGTQFNLADCYAHTQRTASAWALFLDVASSAGGVGQEAREGVARRRAAELEPKLSKLIIVAPKNIGGLQVRRNGESLDGVLWNAPVPVDPGRYTIEASAPGKKTWSTLATVAPSGATVTVTIPDLEVDESAVSAAPPPATAAPLPSPSPDSASQSRSSDGKLEKTVAIVLGGAGVVSVAVGSFFGLRSISKHSDYESLCTGNVCSPAAGPIHDSAVSAGNLSTVAFLLGGALVAGGAVLWVVAPRSPSAADLQVAPLVGKSSAGLSLAGDW